jgi:hypothetical protein
MSLAGNRPRAFELSKRSFWNVANQYCELNLDRTYAASSSLEKGLLKDHSLFTGRAGDLFAQTYGSYNSGEDGIFSTTDRE